MNKDMLPKCVRLLMVLAEDCEVTIGDSKYHLSLDGELLALDSIYYGKRLDYWYDLNWTLKEFIDLAESMTDEELSIAILNYAINVAARSI